MAAKLLREATVVALLAAMLGTASGARHTGSSTTTTTAESCDMCGASASYSETIDGDKRVISSNGCPNHYGVCTGKGTGVCGGLGEEGTGTEAYVQDYTFEVPANPVIATSVDTTPECSTTTVGVAINGVPIYSGAVSANCDILDVDDANAEWTSFDFCGGHGRCLAMDCTGDYHYHFPATCLETQIGPMSDGHSPLIGWSLDGFPIYGPFGPAGTTMGHTSQGCTGTYCLDECSGIEMELPEVDQFKYRYYFNGPLSDLVSLPTDPKPATSDYPFALKCYRGCTYADLSAGAAKCTGGSSGVTDAYTATATAGVTDQFVSGPASAAGLMCSDTSAVTPTAAPDTPSPTSAPTTPSPTPAPTDAPTDAATDASTPAPTDAATTPTTPSPTPAPTSAPTAAPTDAPSSTPSSTPAPTDAPTVAPTSAPTASPTEASPTDAAATPTEAAQTALSPASSGDRSVLYSAAGSFVALLSVVAALVWF